MPPVSARHDGGPVRPREDEFPPGAAEWEDEISRRNFLRIMGASLALGGLGACTKQPAEKIVPYVRQPPEMTPGRPLHFATAMAVAGCGVGLIVTSREGRPVKVEGNPDHPASLGGTSVFAQASILDLYDPDRQQAILRGGQPADWPDFLEAMRASMAAQGKTGGAGLRLLTRAVASPALAGLLGELLAGYPAARVCEWEPVHAENARVGARMAHGRDLDTQYDFAQADVIVALDSDFLFSHPMALRHARQFASRRRLGADARTSRRMSRLYAAEPTPTMTGSCADHRLPLESGEVGRLAVALAARMGVGGGAGAHSAAEAWLDAAARDLAESRGRSIVIAGEGQPPEVHAVAHAINAALGNGGRTIRFSAPAAMLPAGGGASIEELAGEMKAGRVELLVILGGNPAYDAPADLEFETRMEQVGMRVHLAHGFNETSRRCHWVLPAAHGLESWGDVRAADGTMSLVQPLISPLYDGKTETEIVEALLRQPGRTAYDIVHGYWADHGLPDEGSWRKALSDGIVPGPPASAPGAAPISLVPAVPEAAGKGLEVVFRPDPAVWDGTYCNNAWLQELPRPFTKLTWDNAALISPGLAASEGLLDGDVVELEFAGRTISAPVCILPGQARNSVTLHLGYGRTVAGRVGDKTGFNAFKLRTSSAQWFAAGLKLRKTGGTYPLAFTQTKHGTEGRDIIRTGTVGQYMADPHYVEKLAEPRPAQDDTLYKNVPYEGYKWGMVIDLGACIGCGACVVACQAENNIPVVGKYEVSRGRAMHWLRIDDYFGGTPDVPVYYHQPVPCMHCENAPCEVVCPVGATVHDDEGLNVQVYNRCIGTRYCSNNCPYKVRRFNFLELNAGMTNVQKMVKNPDVTVRSRGVMEKCTYCVQRINAARIAAELEDRRIRDGDVTTACQSACPAEAIVFGDINDAGSRVARLKSEPLDYWMLGELNTRPRTSYRARLTNPSPGMKS